MLRIALGKCLLDMGLQEEGLSHLRTAASVSPVTAAQGAVALASSAHGRFFLRTSKALEFMRGDPPS